MWSINNWVMVWHGKVESSIPEKLLIESSKNVR